MSVADRGRFSAKRKREAVLRLLRGEDLDLVSRELGVTGAALAGWRDGFLEFGLEGPRSKPRDERDATIQQLHRKPYGPSASPRAFARLRPGEVTMANELLEAKIDTLEAGLPLARGRSRS